MAQGQDVLASALQDLKKGYEDLFTMHHPILKAIADKSNVEDYKLQGTFREFAVITGGPGDDQGIRFGTETLAAPRRNNGLKGNEYAFRWIYLFAVPNIDLAIVGGKMDLAGIIKKYPDAAVADMRERFARQIASATASAGSDVDGSNANGFTPLNGLHTYNPIGTARTGVFQFVAKASQTGTVHGLPLASAAAAPTPGWYHQYDHTTSFSLDGLRKMRTLAQVANAQGTDLQGGVDLWMCDGGTFQNYLTAMEDKVIVDNKINNPAGNYSRRESLKFGSAEVYWEPAIDLTDTTAWSSSVTQEGVLYGLTTEDWEWFTAGQNADLATNGSWEMEGPIRIPDQDGWQYRIVVHGNLDCTNLRRQLVMTGGANE